MYFSTAFCKSIPKVAGKYHNGVMVWIRNNKGAIAPVYALMAVAMFLTMGGAVDFSRWANARLHND